MAKLIQILLLSLIFMSICQVSLSRTWCVANPSTSNSQLMNNINIACAAVDCSIIKQGGSCFEPNTNINHATVAMNLYYQARGRNPAACNFNGSGNIAITDPSFGHCKLQSGPL